MPESIYECQCESKCPKYARVYDPSPSPSVKPSLSANPSLSKKKRKETKSRETTFNESESVVVMFESGREKRSKSPRKAH